MSETKEKTSGFKRIIADKGSRKLLIFVGIIILVALAVAFHGGGKKQKAEISRLPSAADAGGNISGDRMSPEYMRIRDEKTAQDIKNARQSGSTVTAPIRPVENPRTAMPTSLDGLSEQPPERPHPPVTPRQTQTAPQPPVPQNTYVQPRAMSEQEAQQMAQQQMQMVQAMQQQMAKIIPGPPVPAQVIYFQNPNAQDTINKTGSASRPMLASLATTQGAANDATKGATPPVQQTTPNMRSRFQVPAAGTILYSHLIGRVNSDSPGPVLAEVLQGAFSGARLLGSFQTTSSGLILSFNTMTVPYKDEDGADKTEVISIKSVAVDTSHLGTSMETEVNNHLLLNLGMAFGTSFLQGVGQAVAQSGSYAAMGPYGTTVANPVLTLPGEAMMGFGAGAAQAGTIFQNLYGNKPPTITVEADTPFGLLFLGS